MRGEFDQIQLIKNLIGAPGSNVEVGIGDDAAVLASAVPRMLLCSDALVEGVHFDLAYTTPRELGHKAVAVTLSDIAAMNGTPLYLLVTIALPSTADESFISDFYAGAISLARHYKTEIVGGDLTASKNGIFIDITAVGSCMRPILRSGARPGDLIAVSGQPGVSAAALRALKARGRENVSSSLLQSHILPVPRFDLLPSLNQAIDLCTSMIDISDGLSSEMLHIAHASRVGVEIQTDLIPLHPEAVKEAGGRHQAIELALSGGEDYELLITLAPQFEHSLPDDFTIIGRVVEPARGCTLIQHDGSRSTLVATGYNHFKPDPR
jgi:thiamine-monophosphate kinase